MPVYRILRVVWSWVSSAVTVVALASCAAWLLAIASQGSGAVIRVDHPPRLSSPLRVPLGGQIEYEVVWRYLEGGCRSFVLASFTRKLPTGEETHLYQRRAARVFPVGQPGLEQITRTLPAGISPGLWHYTVDVQSECPTRKPPVVRFSEFDVEVYDPHEPVVTTSSFELLTGRVKRGGLLKYSMEYSRRLDLPTMIAYTFENKDPDTPDDVVFMQHPAASTKTGRHPAAEYTVDLPRDVYEGKWRVRATAATRFPDGHTQVDPLFETELEVVK